MRATSAPTVKSVPVAMMSMLFATAAVGSGARRTAQPTTRRSCCTTEDRRQEPPSRGTPAGRRSAPAFAATAPRCTRQRGIDLAQARHRFGDEARGRSVSIGRYGSGSGWPTPSGTFSLQSWSSCAAAVSPSAPQPLAATALSSTAGAEARPPAITGRSAARATPIERAAPARSVATTH